MEKFDNSLQTNLSQPFDSIVSTLLKESRSADSVSDGVKGFRKQLLSKSARFVLCSQVWLHASPTRNCDVLITLRDADNANSVIEWLQNEIRRNESRLILVVRKHECAGGYGLYFTSKYDNLLKGAEMLRIRKRLKEQFGGGLKDFIYNDAECFEGVDKFNKFLNSKERATIVHSFLRSIQSDKCIDVSGVPLSEGQYIFSQLKSRGLIKHIMPLHCIEDLKTLHECWVRKPFSPQPLDLICDYFGEEIAMYFAWLGYYTCALCFPAAVGFFHWMFLHCGYQVLEDVSVVSFAFVNMIWSTVYLEWWKRLQAEFAYRWGTQQDLEVEQLVEPRQAFAGTWIKSPITGKLELQYPPWRRKLFQCTVSYPATAACILLMFCFMLAIFQFQEFCDSYFGQSKLFSSLTYLPKVTLAIAITISDDLYGKLALYLNDYENYRTDIQYENHLIKKTIVFQFVNSFLSLFYIAFYLQDMDRLSAHLAALLITRQIIGNFKEAVVPLIVELFKLCRLTYKMTASMSEESLHKHVQLIKNRSSVGDDLRENNEDVSEGAHENNLRHRKPFSTNSDNSEKKEVIISSKSSQLHHLSQAELECLLPKYTSPLEDYLEMFIQFGYVLLFSPAFPLAALCALINNIMEIRVDAFKLCTTFQRPFSRRVANIGSWQPAMELMCIIGVIVNCALIGQSDLVKRLWPNLSTAGQILLIVALEHIILSLKYVISSAFDSVPHWVKSEIAKVEFKRREAFKQMESNSRREHSESLQSAKLSSPNYDQHSTVAHFSNENVCKERRARSHTPNCRHRVLVTDL